MKTITIRGDGTNDGISNNRDASSSDAKPADGSEITIECTNIAREIAGKRIVYRGHLDDTTVFVKVFISSSSKCRHMAAELNGLHLLTEKNILAPEVLCSGLTDDGNPAIVTRAINNGSGLDIVWAKSQSESEFNSERRALLGRLIELFAAHHNAGLQHNDPHLKNFFVAESNIYTLDGGDISHSQAPLNESESLQSLAFFLAQFLPDNDRLALGLVTIYIEARGWQQRFRNNKDDQVEFENELKKLILIRREQRKSKYLKKIFRQCSQITSIKNRHSQTLIESNLESRPLTELLNNLDAELTNGRILKDGNTCTVIQLPVGDEAFVVKRYNIKSPFHAIKIALTRSRAERCWESAHLLAFYGITTAAPVAMRIDKTGPFRRQAWFISQYVAGPTLREFIDTHLNQPELLTTIINQAANIVVSLKQFKISHGDLKATNFLVDEGRVILIDLDSLVQHSSEKSFAKAHAKDIHRFQKNWTMLPEINQRFVEALKTLDVNK